MKLYFGPASPYVRKIAVTAIKAWLDDEIERVKPIDNVWIGNGDEEVSRNNPLGKMPTLISREGATLIDSTLICEYLTSLAPEAALLPDLGPERWRVLQLQALAQGLMDATVNRLIEIQIRRMSIAGPVGPPVRKPRCPAL
jgi:glutathione S-transferase